MNEDCEPDDVRWARQAEERKTRMALQALCPHPKDQLKDVYIGRHGSDKDDEFATCGVCGQRLRNGRPD